MKNLLFLLTFLAASFLMTSCGGDAANNAGGAGEEKAKEAEMMKCADLKSKFDELEDKEVTFSAVSWGTNNTTTGDVNLNLGDEPLSGMKQASVVVVFPADKAEAATGLAKDATVKIKATVSESKYGAVYLTNPTIL